MAKSSLADLDRTRSRSLSESEQYRTRRRITSGLVAGWQRSGMGFLRKALDAAAFTSGIANPKRARPRGWAMGITPPGTPAAIRSSRRCRAEQYLSHNLLLDGQLLRHLNPSPALRGLIWANVVVPDPLPDDIDKPRNLRLLLYGQPMVNRFQMLHLDDGRWSISKACRRPIRNCTTLPMKPLSPCANV